MAYLSCAHIGWSTNVGKLEKTGAGPNDSPLNTDKYVMALRSYSPFGTRILLPKNWYKRC